MNQDLPLFKKSQYLIHKLLKNYKFRSVMWFIYDFDAYSQSFVKLSKPASVKGCSIIEHRTLYGIVAI